MIKTRIRKIKSSKDANIVIGTINPFDCKSVFINYSCWFDSDDSQKVKKIFKSEFYKIISQFEYIDKNFILDFDLKENSRNINKSKFLSVEINIYPKNEHLDYLQCVKDLTPYLPTIIETAKLNTGAIFKKTKVF